MRRQQQETQTQHLVEERRQRRLNSCCRDLTDHPEFNCSTTPITAKQSSTTTMGSTTPTPKPTKRRRFSHSRRQRHGRREKNKEQKEDTTRIQLSTQQREFEHELANITHTSTNKIIRKYGFIATDDLSTHLNARRALGNMHPTDYFPTVKIN